MPSHFSTLGMPVESQADMEAIVERAAQNAEKIHCESGFYLRWATEHGAELWIQIDNQENLVGVTPYFRGSAKMRVGITAQVSRPEDTPMEGAVHGWADPQQGKPDEGTYPFVFDVVDIGLYPTLNVPFISTVHLSAFAHELAIYESEEEYDQTEESEPKFASESFIPTGLFSLEEEDSINPAESFAIFTGHILKTEELSNPLTNENYYWMLVKTLGGEFDVVADPQLITNPPVVGGIVSGSFWLCGRVLNPKTIEKKGIFGRLFGR